MLDEIRTSDISQSLKSSFNLEPGTNPKYNFAMKRGFFYLLAFAVAVEGKEKKRYWGDAFGETVNGKYLGNNIE